MESVDNKTISDAKWYTRDAVYVSWMYRYVQRDRVASRTACKIAKQEHRNEVGRRRVADFFLLFFCFQLKFNRHCSCSQVQRRDYRLFVSAFGRGFVLWLSPYMYECYGTIATQCDPSSLNHEKLTIRMDNNATSNVRNPKPKSIAQNESSEKREAVEQLKMKLWRIYFRYPYRSHTARATRVHVRFICIFMFQFDSFLCNGQSLFEQPMSSGTRPK